MKTIAGWVAARHARWETMSPAEQFGAALNALLDLALAAFLAGMVYIGVTGTPGAFYIWVPFLGFMLYIRYRRAVRRWSA